MTEELKDVLRRIAENQEEIDRRVEELTLPNTPQWILKDIEEL